MDLVLTEVFERILSQNKRFIIREILPRDFNSKEMLFDHNEIFMKQLENKFYI